MALRRVWEVTYKKSIAHKSALNMLKMQISTQERPTLASIGTNETDDATDT